MNAESHDRFTRDLEKAIRRSLPDHPEEPSGTATVELEILRSLAEADFSAESKIRHSLKRRLLDPSRAGGRMGDRTGTAVPWLKPVDGSRAVPRRIAMIGVLITLLVLAASPLGAAVAQSLVKIFESRQVGENTSAVSVEGDFEAIRGEDGETVLMPVPEAPAITGEIPVEETGERSLTLDPTVPFDQAQEMVRFTLKMPAFVPEGYTFIGVVVIRTGQASVEFVNAAEGRLIGLLQTAVGGADGKVQITYTSDMLAIDTEVAGQPVLWTQAGDEGLLIWEAGGVNYQLVGVSDLETALRIAESLP